MNFIKSHSAFILILSALIIFQSCKTKKLIQKPVVSADTSKKAHYVQVATPAKMATPQPIVAAATPQIDINKAKIQFEFDSSVLKTEAYPVLDEVALFMKTNPSEKFVLRGYASFEGTPEHNIVLSADRANSVRTYLINGGVNAENIIAKGYGTANPIGDNDTESGRILNRRVEVGYQNTKKYSAQTQVK
jgi:outer membrane protein OmpA-like peptidoglycan-associated protein